MKVRRLLVPGRFQDVYVYRGWFIGLTDYRSLKFVHLPTASEHVLRFLKTSEPAANDDALAERDAGQPTPHSSISQHAPEVLEAPAAFTGDVDLLVNANVVLDLAVYREHLYLGTAKGYIPLLSCYRASTDAFVQSWSASMTLAA